MKYDSLIITPCFRPNIGGVETHLDDLVNELKNAKINTLVLTLAPLTTKNTTYLNCEEIGSVKIIRFGWKSSYLYHWSENYPIINMLYIFPYFFIRCLVYIIGKKINTKNIHCQGVNAGLVGLILNLKLKSKKIISTHALYEVDKKRFFKYFLKLFFAKFDCILCVSKASKKQILSINPNLTDVFVYVYWVNTQIFKKIKNNKKEKIIFTFVGRLIEKKGVKYLVEASKKFSNAQFNIIGVGPEEDYIVKEAKKFKNLNFLGKISNSSLPEIYSNSNYICLPSLYEEGLARVMLESLACSTPIIATSLGSIKEALDDEVAFFIEPNLNSFFSTIENCISINESEYLNKTKKCREKALSKFSEKNINLITKHYLL